MRRGKKKKKKEKLQLRKSMDWEWGKFAWEETENLTEERINDTLLVGSEKKIKEVEIQVGHGGNNSEEKLKKRVSRTRVVQSSRSPKRDSNLTCLVDGCKADLSNCKDYHRRHRVCERHSKIPVVLVRGEEQRFCQQCSRFHSLGEFDEVKRSCRERLDGHNRRRRKPQPESIYLTPKDFLSNFKGPRMLQFSSSQLNMPDLDAKIALAPYVWKTESEAIVDNRRKRIPAIDWKTPPNPSVAHVCHVGDKHFSLKQTKNQKGINQKTPQISSCNPLPLAIAWPESGRGSHGVSQPVNSGCALYLLSPSNNQKDINQKTPQISSCNPLPLAIASPESGRGSHGVSQPVNSGCALYLLSPSPSPSQASGLGLSCFDLPQEYYYAYSREPTAIPQDAVFQTRVSDGSIEAELSPSLLTCWE